MKVNGEAIYATRPVAPYKEGRLALTRKRDTVYAIYLADEGETRLPERITLASVHPKPGSKVRLLGAKESLPWRLTDAGLEIRVPDEVNAALPCRHAFAFKIATAND
jgi:alpha-L-fucosidase